MIPVALAFFRANWLPIALAAAVLSGLWLVYDRGRDDANARHDAAMAKAERIALIAEAALAKDVATIGADTATEQADIARIAATVRRTIQQELANDPRFNSPACQLGPDVMRAVNAALGGQPATPAP